MTRDPLTHAVSIEEGPAEERECLFDETIVGTPIEELAAVHAKKQEVFARLGEDDKLRLHERSYQIARSRLAARMGMET